jgi:hypothetical protein
MTMGSSDFVNDDVYNDDYDLSSNNKISGEPNNSKEFSGENIQEGETINFEETRLLVNNFEESKIKIITKELDPKLIPAAIKSKKDSTNK